MKAQWVLSRKQMPTSVPVFETLTLFLILERFNAPQYVWGAIGVVWIFIFIACVVSVIKQKYVELFEITAKQKSEGTIEK